MKLYSIDDFRIDKFCIDQYRLDNYRMDGAGGGGTIIEPVTVVNAAYSTEGNGGRKLVRLSNGWLVCGVYDTANSIIKLYVSKDNGSTFSLLGTYRVSNSFSVSSYGTRISILCTVSTDYQNYFVSFDAIDGDGGDIRNLSSTIVKNIDISQTSFGSGCSLVIDENGNIYAAWASKNSTYPNSFNIRYSKSLDGGATWATPTQITTINTSGQDYTNPCVVIGGDGKPHIIVQHDAGTTFFIKSFDFTTAWTEHTVYSGSTYVQSNPCADTDGAGQLNCVWRGYGASHTSTYHIFFNKSTNNGSTWGTTVDVAVGENPSITHDEGNNLYVQYQRSGTIYQKKSTDHGATWGAEAIIGAGTNASACSNYDKFIQPLSIWKGASSVLFAGVFEP